MRKQRMPILLKLKFVTLCLMSMMACSLIGEAPVNAETATSQGNSSQTTNTGKVMETPKLRIQMLTTSSVKLFWAVSNDNTNVGFNIYQNEVLIGSTKEASYTINALDPQKEYTFVVRSKDTAGIESESSNAVKKGAMKRFKYNYDSSGRLTSIEFASGKKIAYAYDANGNLIKTTVTNP